MIRRLLPALVAFLVVPVAEGPLNRDDPRNISTTSYIPSVTATPTVSLSIFSPVPTGTPELNLPMPCTGTLCTKSTSRTSRTRSYPRTMSATATPATRSSTPEYDSETSISSPMPTRAPYFTSNSDYPPIVSLESNPPIDADTHFHFPDIPNLLFLAIVRARYRWLHIIFLVIFYTLRYSHASEIMCDAILLMLSSCLSTFGDAFSLSVLAAARLPVLSVSPPKISKGTATSALVPYHRPSLFQAAAAYISFVKVLPSASRVLPSAASLRRLPALRPLADASGDLNSLLSELVHVRTSTRFAGLVDKAPNITRDISPAAFVGHVDPHGDVDAPLSSDVDKQHNAFDLRSAPELEEAFSDTSGAASGTHDADDTAVPSARRKAHRGGRRRRQAWVGETAPASQPPPRSSDLSSHHHRAHPPRWGRRDGGSTVSVVVSSSSDPVAVRLQRRGNRAGGHSEDRSGQRQ